MTQTQEQAEKIKSIEKHRPAVQARGGALTFGDIDSLQRLTNYLHASRMLPQQYNTPEKIGAGIQYAVQLGFGNTWLLALRQIAVINGTASMFGDLPLALVRNSGQLEAFDEYLVDKDGKRICLENKNISAEFYAAVCSLKRTGGFQATEIFTVHDAVTAGVWGKNVWKVYPKRMIQMRVRSIALKNMFADVLNGMSIGEYDFNTTIEHAVESEVMPSSPANKLNALAGEAEIQPAVAMEPEVLPAEPTESDSTTAEESQEEDSFSKFK
jgi:hypothetical protein